MDQRPLESLAEKRTLSTKNYAIFRRGRGRSLCGQRFHSRLPRSRRRSKNTKFPGRILPRHRRFACRRPTSGICNRAVVAEQRWLADLHRRTLRRCVTTVVGSCLSPDKLTIAGHAMRARRCKPPQSQLGQHGSQKSRSAAAFSWRSRSFQRYGDLFPPHDSDWQLRLEPAASPSGPSGRGEVVCERISINLSSCSSPFQTASTRLRRSWVYGALRTGLTSLVILSTIHCCGLHTDTLPQWDLFFKKTGASRECGLRGGSGGNAPIRQRGQVTHRLRPYWLARKAINSYK